MTANIKAVLTDDIAQTELKRLERALANERRLLDKARGAARRHADKLDRLAVAAATTEPGRADWLLYPGPLPLEVICDAANYTRAEVATKVMRAPRRRRRS